MAAPTVMCEVTSIKWAKGVTVVQARCPKDSPHQPKAGHRGVLYDAAGAAIAGGDVVVKQVKGDQVTAEGKQPKAPKAARLRINTY
jgi:hypothetical protein